MTSCKFQIGDRVWREFMGQSCFGIVINPPGLPIVKGSIFIQWEHCKVLEWKDELRLIKTGMDKLDEIL